VDACWHKRLGRIWAWQHRVNPIRRGCLSDSEGRSAGILFGKMKISVGCERN
jgi:hypothetical protein